MCGWGACIVGGGGHAWLPRVCVVGGVCIVGEGGHA